MFEVEIKFRVKNEETIYDQLKKLNCKFSNLHQCDHIYVKKGINDFNIPSGENVLRIREENGLNYITLKQRLNHLEYETVVKDLNVMNNILVALEYHKLVEVNKFRKQTSVNEFNITIDKVDRLGTFVEIEKITNDKEKIEIIEHEILKFAKELGFTENDIEREKYDSMMLKLRWLR